MSEFKPIWHQAITNSLLDGKLFRKNYTVIFSISSPVCGDQIRIRFSNLLGKENYEIGSLSINCNGTFFPVTFHGKQSFSIPMGMQVYSDPVEVKVAKAEDIGIRLFYRNQIIDCNMIEEEANWIKGDATYLKELPSKIHKPLAAKILGSYNAIPAIDLIEVRTDDGISSIVAFGDSITALSKWTKPLNERLQKEYGGRYVLLNSGIAGNCLLHETDGFFAPVFGQKGTARFQRDVLDLPNVKAVIIALGVNDVSYLSEETKDIINEENFIHAITDIVNKLHERNIRVTMSTITPRLKVARTMGRYDMKMEELRLRLNAWIRSAGIFDYVIDQEKVVADRDENGLFFKEGFHQGDHLHPNDEGGKAMAEAYDLKKLTGE
ncbi:MAG: hypothetical protein IKD94_04245 [Erysipelotrichaceae bacterium]|nr:hypothetical protein [Erysipelotrichaceae bacterium]